MSAPIDVEKLLAAFIQGAQEYRLEPEKLELAAQRIEELGQGLPSDQEVLAIVHAFVERVPGMLRAIAQEPRP